MHKFVYKDHKRRKILSHIEKKNFVKKIFFNNTLLKNSFRINSKSNSNFYKISKVKLNNRCIVTGRKAKIAKNLNFSRIQLLKLSRSGFISGIRKSCW